jgi:carbonic anhydrase
MPTPQILAGIAEFQQYFQENRELLVRLATRDQSPEALYIGCSDSRVPIELLAKLEPGSLFVTRNIANIVPPYGTGEMGIGAVVEYAVLHLHVKHIVIMGHTGCGGLKALDQPPDWSREPHLARWIEHARPAKTKVEVSGLPEEARPLATVRENVLLQLEHLRSYDPVRDGERAGTLTLHGWVYHLETGGFESYDPNTYTWTALTATEA